MKTSRQVSLRIVDKDGVHERKELFENIIKNLINFA